MKMKLDNNRCILVEFKSSHQLSVGYLSWVKDNITLPDVANYISNKVEVSIKWPKMWPLMTTAKLEKLFDQIEFDEYKVTILASGSFVEMSSLAKNAETYGFLNTSLKTRSRLKRKNNSEMSDDEDTLVDSVDSEEEIVRTYETRSRVQKHIKMTNSQQNASKEHEKVKANDVHKTTTQNDEKKQTSDQKFKRHTKCESDKPEELLKNTTNINKGAQCQGSEKLKGNSVHEPATSHEHEKKQTSDQNFRRDKIDPKVLPTPECESDKPEELLKNTTNDDKNINKGTQGQVTENLKDNGVHEAATFQKDENKQTSDQNFKRHRIILPTPECDEEKNISKGTQCQVIDLTCDIGEEKGVNIDSLLLKYKILQLEYQVKCKESNKLLVKNNNLEAELANLKQEKESMELINCSLHRESIELEMTIEEIKQKNIVQVNFLKEENERYKDFIFYLAKDIPITKTFLKNERKKIDLLEAIVSGKNIREVNIKNLLKNSIINNNNTSLQLSRDNINEKSVKIRTDNLIKLGNSEYKVPESCLLHDSISDLTGKLFLALFTENEIRELSSKLIFDKRIKALEDYVFTKYERSADNQQLLNLVIKSKFQDVCNI